jgi:hypothetical protein
MTATPLGGMKMDFVLVKIASRAILRSLQVVCNVFVMDKIGQAITARAGSA